MSGRDIPWILSLSCRCPSLLNIIDGYLDDEDGGLNVSFPILIMETIVDWAAATAASGSTDELVRLLAIMEESCHDAAVTNMFDAFLDGMWQLRGGPELCALLGPNMAERERTWRS